MKSDLAVCFVWLLSGYEDALRRSVKAKWFGSLKCLNTWLS